MATENYIDFIKIYCIISIIITAFNIILYWIDNINNIQDDIPFGIVISIFTLICSPFIVILYIIETIYKYIKEKLK